MNKGVKNGSSCLVTHTMGKAFVFLSLNMRLDADFGGDALFLRKTFFEKDIPFSSSV